MRTSMNVRRLRFAISRFVGDMAIDGAPYQSGEHNIDGAPYQSGEHNIDGAPYQSGEYIFNWLYIKVM